MNDSIVHSWYVSPLWLLTVTYLRKVRYLRSISQRHNFGRGLRLFIGIVFIFMTASILPMKIGLWIFVS